MAQAIEGGAVEKSPWYRAIRQHAERTHRRVWLLMLSSIALSSILRVCVAMNRPCCALAAIREKKS